MSSKWSAGSFRFKVPWRVGGYEAGCPEEDHGVGMLGVVL
jgi:hypothetical protein